MATQDELIVRIGADFDELKKGLSGATKQTEKFGKKVKVTSDSTSAALSGMAKKALAVAAGFVAINKATGVFFGTIDKARELSNFSKRLDVSRETFSKLSVVAKSVGAETEDLYDVFKDFSVRVTDAANGAKSYDDVLKQIGLNSRELARMKPEDQFLAFSDALSKASDSMALFAVDELVSDPGVRMIEVLKMGSKEINKMGEEFRATGRSLSEADFKQLEQAAKAQRELNLAFEKFGNILSAKIAPYLTKIMEDLNYELSEAPKNFRFLQEELIQLYKLRNDRESEGGFLGWFGREEDLAALDKRIQDKMNEIATKVKAMQDSGALSITPTVGGTSGNEAVAEARRNNLNDMIEDAMAAEMTLVDITRRSEAEKLAIVQANEEAQQALRDQYNRQTLNGAKYTLGTLSTLMESENRKMFEVGKAASIAETIINTIEGAQKAFTAYADIPKVGPIIGAAAAAAVVASGMARVSKIRSTKMGGGGTVSAGGGFNAPSIPSEQGGGVIQQTNVDVTLQGSQFSETQVRELIGQINAQADDNFVVRTA